jgi:hypothetical protein
MRFEPTTLRTERVYLVGDLAAPDSPDLPTWTLTREQAWEAIRVKLVHDLDLTGGEDATLRRAIEELDEAGPRGDGDVVALADHTYFYRPRVVARPEGLSRGDAALLLAVATA